MAIVEYSKQGEYDLANSGQDCMGWTVIDQAGNELGRVTEMLIDTDREMVDSVILNREIRIPAEDFALRNERVVVRGIFEGVVPPADETAGNETAIGNADYAASQAPNPRRVAGLTREAQENEIRMPIIEEELRVGKKAVRSGGARIQTHVEKVPVEQQVTLHEERVSVERRPVDRMVENAPGAFKEGTIEVKEMSEVPVIDKQVRVSEEIVINKEIIEHEETVRDTVRRRDVEVDKYTADERNRTNE